MGVNGRLLKSAREERGLTQTQLGDKVGVTHGYIIEIEKGRMQASDKLKAKLAKALEIPNIMLYADQLYDGLSSPDLEGAIDNAIDIAINIMYNKK